LEGTRAIFDNYFLLQSNVWMVCGHWKKMLGIKMYFFGHDRYHVVENVSVAPEPPGIGVGSHFFEISILGSNAF
jgi:hypothetical protein